jgi:hypothetical protein
MVEVRSPRAVFVDYPAGRTFGCPGAGDDHQRVLAAALDELAHFTLPGQIRDLPYQWERDGNRSWEAALRKEVLGPPFPEEARKKPIRLQSSR